MREKEKHLQVGKICRYEKDENKKIEKLMEIYNENKDDYDLLVTIARNIGYDKKYRERAKEILHTLFNYADTPYVYYSLARLELLDKNYKKAKEYTNTVLSFDPNNRESLSESIRIDKENNFFDVEKLKKLANFHNDPIAAFELAKSYELNGDYKNALEYYEQVLRIKEDDLKSLFSIAKIKRKQGYTKSAKKILKKIIKLNPKDFIALSELATLEYNDNNIELSKKLYEKALSIKEDGAVASNLGKIYNHQGDFEKAYDCLKIAYENYYNYQPLLGTVAKKIRKFDEAKEWYLESEQNYKTFLELTNLYARENDFESALFYLIKAYNLIDEESDLRNFYRLETYIKHNLGVLNENKWNKDSLFYNQLINYDENKVIEKNKELFYDDFDLKKNLSFIKENINEENYATTSGCIDYYLIGFDSNIGTKEGLDTNYVSVMTILGTDKIVSISPFNIHSYISTKNIRRQRK